MFQVHKKVLNNGLRVLMVPMKNSEAVTIQVLVGAGSKNEAKNINGISHFLEHLFFKGTENRPNPGDLDKELDKIGASHNAFTGQELTGYWIKSSGKDFDIVLDIMSDIVLNSLFKKEEIEKERNVILQEISMNEDLPIRKVLEDLLKIIYGIYPAGWPIAGTTGTVKKIKRSDILSYQKNSYSAENMIVIVSGGIERNEIIRKINKVFKNLKKGKIKKIQKTKVYQKSPRVKILNKKTDQSHLAIGIPVFNIYDERRYALNILSAVLGGNTSSKLFMEIRQKLGLAYYVGSLIDLQKDTGLLIIRAGVSHDNLEVAIKKISEILSDFKNKGVSKKELKDAKSFIRGQMALSFETTDQVADFYGEHELFYKKIMQPEELLKKIEKVSQNDILKTAREIFRPDKINMAVIGKHHDYKEKEQFYKKLFNKI
ncbi:MAG: pitrilysin family protein [Patescibacteria group bacterium]